MKGVVLDPAQIILSKFFIWLYLLTLHDVSVPFYNLYYQLHSYTV